jgi:hypothetical protein
MRQAGVTVGSALHVTVTLADVARMTTVYPTGNIRRRRAFIAFSGIAPAALAVDMVHERLLQQDDDQRLFACERGPENLWFLRKICYWWRRLWDWRTTWFWNRGLAANG